MIRTVMVFSLIFAAGYYSYQKFGVFSVHQAALQSPHLLKLTERQPVVKPVSDPDEPSALQLVLTQWMDVLKSGVNVRPSVYRSDASPLKLANITSQAVTVLIQSELHRVGCFAGRIDGRWNEGTSRSLNSFSETALLPIAHVEPSLETLAVLRQASGRVCPKPCLEGYFRNPSGVCERPAQEAQIEGSSKDVASVSETDADLLPRRNPARLKSRPLISASLEGGKRLGEVDIALPHRKLRTQKTALSIGLSGAL